jgi:rRNA-processing protein FCF1
VEARALVYQGILITNENEGKLELTKILKDLFTKDGIQDAFKDELSEILKEIDIYEVPSNYTNFYYEFISKEKEEESLTKIKINNKIIHQSKLLNYFTKDIKKENIEKDLNDLLKKIKKNKKYYISTKDIILIESLKSDGVEVLKKYEDLYEIDNSNMPNDIQLLIDNGEAGLALLRLVEIIGQDEIESIGAETLYFIISTLNQLDIDPLRNKILLKILPLKVKKYN